jgi:hypothetical protein
MPAAMATKPTLRAEREALAKQKVALEGQCLKLGQALAEARAVSNRATATAAVDGSKAATDAKVAATGAVVRAEAELRAAQDALAQVETDLVDLDKRRADGVRVAKLKTAATAARKLIADAKKADEAAAKFADSYKALIGGIGGLYSAVPNDFKEQVFGGGHNLGAQSISSTAEYLISQSGLLKRPVYAPADFRQQLATLVERYLRPLLDQADATPEPEAEWE